MNILKFLVLCVTMILTRQEKVKHKRNKFFERYIMSRLTLLEETIFYQENEIQQLKESNNQLKTSIKNVNYSTPQNQDETVLEQRKEILKLKHSNEQLKMDMMILNGSLEILLKQEEIINQQRDEILQIRNNEEQLMNDLMTLNESLNMLHDQVQILSEQANSPKVTLSSEIGREYSTSNTSTTLNNAISRPVLSTSSDLTTVQTEPTTLISSVFTVPNTGNTGMEFVTMFPNTQHLHNQFVIASKQPGWVVIKIPAAGIEDNVTLDKGSTYWDVSKVAGFGSNRGILEKIIYLKSSVPITLYSVILDHESDPYITPIYDLQTLGAEYIVGSFRKFCIISTRNSTNVFVQFGRINLDYLSHVILHHNSFPDKRILSNYPMVVIEFSSTAFRQCLPTSYFEKTYIVPYIPDIFYSFDVMPLNGVTNISTLDGTLSRQERIYGFIIKSMTNFGFLTANDTNMIYRYMEYSLEKEFLIPPVSKYAYAYLCPFPHIFSPRYEHFVLMLVPSSTIDGIKVNNHVITNKDTRETITQSGFNAILVSYNVLSDQYVHVVSENIKVAVFVIGHIRDREHYLYVYNCVS